MQKHTLKIYRMFGIIALLVFVSTAKRDVSDRQKAVSKILHMSNELIICLDDHDITILFWLFSLSRRRDNFIDADSKPWVNWRVEFVHHQLSNGKI